MEWNFLWTLLLGRTETSRFFKSRMDLQNFLLFRALSAAFKNLFTCFHNKWQNYRSSREKIKFVVFSVFQASLPSNNPDFDAKLCGCIKKKDRKFWVICQIIHRKFTSCNVKIRCDSVKSRGRCFPLTFSDGLGNVSAKSFWKSSPYSIEKRGALSMLSPPHNPKCGPGPDNRTKAALIFSAVLLVL